MYGIWTLERGLKGMIKNSQVSMISEGEWLEYSEFRGFTFRFQDDYFRVNFDHF
jgi:hypothetical protein